MKKNIGLFMAVFVCCIAVKAQQLKQFELTIPADSIAYISLTQQKVLSSNQAAANKQAADFALVITKDAFGKQAEWYNLSGKDGKTPARVNGTKNGIAAISFDKEQFDHCNSTADLARMTGHITKNSFSHFSGIGNSNGITQHCFIIETEAGKRGLIYVTDAGQGQLKASFKLQ
ncbi:MAG: hypothetical protein U0V75_10670 [Ferruginibacter sp.]